MYKYMSDKVAPLFARTLKVRFTQPSDLNDPFEFRPLLDFEATAAEVRDLVEARIDAIYGTPDGMLAMMEKLQRSDPNYPKLAVPIQVFRQMIAANPDLENKFMAEMKRRKDEILANERMAALWEAHWEGFRQTLGQMLGIFSLTEDSENVLMWSHYASEHRGVVVELDESHPWFNQKIAAADDIRHLVQVSYVQNPHPHSWKKVSGTEMLYQKDAVWAYEREWRMIRPLKDGAEVDTGVVCFDLPPESIRSITFGCRTSADLEKEIRACYRR